MDRDAIVTMIKKLVIKLNNLDPVKDAETFKRIEEDIIRLSRLCAEYDDMCDKQNERQAKLDIERDSLKFEQQKFEKEIEIKLKEIDLKIKELEFKDKIESKKVEQANEEAASRKKAAKAQAIWDLIKVLLQIVGTAGLIGFTGKLEQSVILGNHKWSLIQKAFKP